MYRLIYIGRSTGGLNTRESILEIYLYYCDEAVVLSNLSLPEFVNGRKISNLSAQVFDSENCHYDVILGRDFMDSIGLDIQFSTGSIKWLDTIVDMKHISMYDHIKEDITDIGI